MIFSHPNPAKVLCRSVFDPGLPAEAFELVTLIGSTVDETGDFKRCLDACFHLLKPGGYLMFMASLRSCPPEKLEAYVRGAAHRLEELKVYDAFPEYPFFIAKIGKVSAS